ncbi:MAG: Crp/Fnr family transcriptional regulator [Bacteroidota bacterium]
MELLEFLEQKELFTKEECVTIDEAFERKVVSKGTVIQKVNRYSKKLLFIESGLLRTFYVKEGKDITHFFFDENYFIAPVNSIYFNKSEIYEWEAIETCIVRVIPFEEFLLLGERFPRLTRIILDFSIQMLDLFSQKLNLLQFQTAVDRYSIFLQMYPDLINRVSLGDTASFLGLTQQTLSAIRSKKKQGSPHFFRTLSIF